LENEKKVAVGVSGGADSIALTFLLAQLSSIRFVALTVNHNLREEGAREAEQVHKLLARHKIEHHILNWEHKEKILSNIQHKARLARRELLSNWCQGNAIKTLLLAHTKNDIAETFFMNIFRGSGIYGLSSIPEKTIISHNTYDLQLHKSCNSSSSRMRGSSDINSSKRPISRECQTTLDPRIREDDEAVECYEYKIQIIRPVSIFTKDELKNFLQEKNIDWIEDPSNQNKKFLRTKVRDLFSSKEMKHIFPDENLFLSRVLTNVKNITRARDCIELITKEKYSELVTKLGEDIQINRKQFCDTHPEIALNILSSCLITVSGQHEYKPRLDSLELLYNFIRSSSCSTKTLWKCKIKIGKDIIHLQKEIGKTKSSPGK
jgi:tRNA(Ile)-lysidine synthase